MGRTQRVRQVQHKPSDKENNKELAEVKRENQQLKRKIAKLQKQLQKLMDQPLEVEEEEAVILPKLEKGDVSKCVDCGSVSLRTVALPNGVLTMCKDCGKRSLMKKAS